VCEWFSEILARPGRSANILRRLVLGRLGPMSCDSFGSPHWRFQLRRNGGRDYHNDRPLLEDRSSDSSSQILSSLDVQAEPVPAMAERHCIRDSAHYADKQNHQRTLYPASGPEISC